MRSYKHIRSVFSNPTVPAECSHRTLGVLTDCALHDPESPPGFQCWRVHGSVLGSSGWMNETQTLSSRHLQSRGHTFPRRRNCLYVKGVELCDLENSTFSMGLIQCAFRPASLLPHWQLRTASGKHPAPCWWLSYGPFPHGS